MFVPGLRSIRPALDQVNGAAQNETTANFNRLAAALRIASRRFRKTETKLE